MIYGFYSKQKAHVNITMGRSAFKSIDRNYDTEYIWHRALLDAGFGYNETHDFYFSKDGALMSDSGISIEELCTYPKFSECVQRGYEMVYGDPTPDGISRGITRAIYCKNYKDIVARHRETPEGMAEIEALQADIQASYEGVNRNSRRYGRH